MAVKIELKRSAVPGKVPTVAQLDLGEMAINTYDAKVYFKQDTGVTQSIVQLATTAGSGSSVVSASHADYADNAGNAATAGFATTAGSALTAVSASYALNATNAISSSYALSSSYSVSGSFAQTASYALNIPDTASFAVSASHANTSDTSISASHANASDTAISSSYSLSGSYALTASFALNVPVTSSYAISASHADIADLAIQALTASSADNFVVRNSITASNALVNGTITAQTLNVQYITSSTEFITGSTKFGSQLTDTHQFTGSVTVTGSLSLNGSPVLTADQTGSITVLSASYARTASYVNALNQDLIVNGLITASGDIKTQTNLIAVQGIQAPLLTSFNVLGLTGYNGIVMTPTNGNLEVTGTLAVSRSVIAPSFTGSLFGTASWAVSASHAPSALTSSYAISASHADNADNAISSSYALSSSYAISSSNAISASYAFSSSNAVSSSFAITASVTTQTNFTGAFSGSLDNLQGVASYVPFFSSSQVLTTSSIWQMAGQPYIVINQTNVDSQAPEALYVWQPNTSSYNVISGKGNLNNYLQLNIQNLNSGTSASSDVVATANNGSETDFYIDMGINGENFVDNGNAIGGANDAYLYSTGNNLHIGNASTGSYHLGFFVGGFNTETNKKLQLNGNDLHSLTGSLNATQGFTGSLFGTASWAVTASYALNVPDTASFAVSASHADNADQSISSSYALTASFALNIPVTSSFAISASHANNADQAISSSFAVSASHASNTNTAISASYALTASYINPLQQNVSITGAISITGMQTLGGNLFLNKPFPLVYNNDATNNMLFGMFDGATIYGAYYQTFGNQYSNITQRGGAEFVYDIRNNPDANFHVASFNGSTWTQKFIVNDGGVQVTGSLSAPSITGSLFGTSSWAVTASYALNVPDTASFAVSASHADNADNAISSSYALSASHANNADNAISASYSLSGSYAISSSYALNATTASYALTATSASHANNADNAISSSYAISASHAPTSLSSSYAISSSHADNADNSISSSYAVTSSYAEIATSASYSLSGSYSVSSSYAISASNAQTASFAISASYAVSASFVTGTIFTEGNVALSSSYSSFLGGIPSSSFATTGSNTFYGKETISGSIRFSDTIDPDPTGTDTTVTYLFNSASNTTLGRDLFFRQDGNLVKWKWIEGQLQTGLLYGGVLSSSGSTIYVSSGSGIIMSYNASTGSEVSPMAQYVTWGPITSSLTYLTSSSQTYVYIDSTGTLRQQTSWFTPDQYTTAIPLGVFGHGDRTASRGTGGDVATVYGTANQSFDFIRAFGPLKIDGLTIAPISSSLSISTGAGIGFVLGGFYQQDQNNVSHRNIPAAATSSFARWYRSGSDGQFISDTNGGSFYTTIDNQRWDNGSGTLQTVGNNSWTIQRVFINPTALRAAVYYGQKLYSSLADAQSNISSDPFVEAPLTAHNNIFAGYLIVQGNASNTNLADTNLNAIVQSGLFRNTVGGSGGTTFATTLESLSDVDITSPANGQALIYQGGLWINGNPTTAATASYVLNAVSSSFAQTASYLANGATASAAISASYAVSSSYSITSSYAISSSNAVSSSYAISSSNAISSSYAITASHAPTSLTSSNAVTASYALTASFVNPLNQNVQITGSLNTSANIQANKFVFTDGVINESNTGQLMFAAGGNYLYLYTGPNGLYINNQANSANNVIITDAGTVQTRGSITAGAPGNDQSIYFGGTNAGLYWAGSGASIAYSVGALQFSSVGSPNNMILQQSGGALFNYGITGSLLGNASTATSASYAATASYFVTSSVTSASFATSASYAVSASNSISGSYALTASFALNVPQTSSFAISASYAVSSSNAISSSYAISSSLSLEALSAQLAQFAISSSFATTASFALNTGGISATYVADEGVTLGTASYFDFQGAGVTASVANGTASITIGGGGAAIQGASQVFNQPTPANTWSFSHGINSRTPVVELYDSNYNAIIPTRIFNPGPFATNIYFDVTQSGFAIISTGGVLSVTGSNSVLNQTVAATTWSFEHNLQTQYPVFTIYDANNDVIIPQRINVVSTSSADIYFSTPRTGKAVASLGGYSTFVSSSASSSYSDFAVTSSYALTASYALNVPLTASNANTASYAFFAVTASNANTASYVANAITSSLAVTASYALTASAATTFNIGGSQQQYARVAASVVGSNNLFTQATGSFTAGFYKYTITSGSNARSGEVWAVWNAGTVQYTDNSTVDIGTTTAVTFSVSIVSSQAQFNAQTNTSDWNIKSFVTYM